MALVGTNFVITVTHESSGALEQSAPASVVTLRQNEDMRRITAWAAILATNTAIAGIYGMNLALMAAVCFVLLSLFRRRHWL